MTRGVLKEKEPHPAINAAIEYFNSISFDELCVIKESFASCAIEGNRLSEICLETLSRLEKREPISDRYFLGLVWAVRTILEG